MNNIFTLCFVIILEAFALGKSVIATDVGGIPEVVRNGFNGILVNSRDVTTLADSLDLLLLNPRRSIQMGRNGYDFVKTNYTFEMQVKKYLSIYNKLIKHHDARQ